MCVGFGVFRVGATQGSGAAARTSGAWGGRGREGREVSRALVTSSCHRGITAQVYVQSGGERSSRVREYTCDRSH